MTWSRRRSKSRAGDAATPASVVDPAHVVVAEEGVAPLGAGAAEAKKAEEAACRAGAAAVVVEAEEIESNARSY